MKDLRKLKTKLKTTLSGGPILKIIILALAARFFVAFGTNLPWFSTDSVNYISQAKALLQGEYQYYFPNGYPLIISFFILISSLFPYHVGLILLNIIMSTVSIILIYSISAKYFGETSNYPLFAALVAAFYPNQLNYVRFILTEVPATFFLILSLYLFTKEKNCLAGLSAGFAAAIRTTLLPVAVLFSLFLIYKRKLREGLLVLFFSLIPISVFLVYGYFKTGNFTLYIDTPKVFYISLGLHEVPIDFTNGLNEYFSYMFSHPINFVYDRISSLWNMWGFLPSASEGLRGNIFFRMLLALRFPLILLAFYGFIKTRKNIISVYLIMPAFIITLIHALIITSANEAYIANPRYIFPTEPFLIVLALIGLESLFAKSFSKDKEENNY